MCAARIRRKPATRHRQSHHRRADPRTGCHARERRAQHRRNHATHARVPRSPTDTPGRPAYRTPPQRGDHNRTAPASTYAPPGPSASPACAGPAGVVPVRVVPKHLPSIQFTARRSQHQGSMTGDTDDQHFFHARPQEHVDTDRSTTQQGQLESRRWAPSARTAAPNLPPYRSGARPGILPARSRTTPRAPAST